jgi:hypothetical protein
MNSIRYICAAAAATALCFGWVAFAAEKSGDKPPVMYVQTAGGISLKDGTLTLMSPTTTFMSGNMVGKMPCQNFVQAWSDSGDSFKKDPPKAILMVMTPEGEKKKMDVTLRNPRFEGQNLLYDVSYVSGSAPEGKHGAMQESALFMNDIRLASFSSCDIYHCAVNGG